MRKAKKKRHEMKCHIGIAWDKYVVVYINKFCLSLSFFLINNKYVCDDDNNRMIFNKWRRLEQTNWTILHAIPLKIHSCFVACCFGFIYSYLAYGQKLIFKMRSHIAFNDWRWCHITHNTKSASTQFMYLNLRTNSLVRFLFP